MFIRENLPRDVIDRSLVVINSLNDSPLGHVLCLQN